MLLLQSYHESFILRYWWYLMKSLSSLFPLFPHLFLLLIICYRDMWWCHDVTTWIKIILCYFILPFDTQMLNTTLRVLKLNFIFSLLWYQYSKKTALMWAGCLLLFVLLFVVCSSAACQQRLDSSGDSEFYSPTGTDWLKFLKSWEPVRNWRYCKYHWKHFYYC